MIPQYQFHKTNQHTHTLVTRDQLQAILKLNPTHWHTDSLTHEQSRGNRNDSALHRLAPRWLHLWIHSSNGQVCALSVTLYVSFPLSPTLGLTLGRSRSGVPNHLLPCFLFALVVLLTSSVHVWSRSLSFYWVGLWSATGKRWSRAFARVCIARRASRFTIHNRDVHCLEDRDWGVWCKTKNKNYLPYYWVGLHHLTGRYVPW